MRLFGIGHKVIHRASSVQFSPVVYTSGLSAKVKHLINAVSMREKKSQNCFEVHQFMVQMLQKFRSSNENFYRVEYW